MTKLNKIIKEEISKISDNWKKFSIEDYIRQACHKVADEMEREMIKDFKDTKFESIIKKVIKEFKG